MKRVLLATPYLLGVFAHDAQARGVSPYLPLNLEPEIERQIERVLILGDKSVMTRPIAAAAVIDALPKACSVDRELCERVRQYLGRYTRSSGVTELSIEGAATSGASRVVPNSYGMASDSAYRASAQAYFQPNDHLLLNAGGIAYDGNSDPAGSVISLGFSYAQLDIGYRGHWFSPFTDSSMLLSTEAPTMPSMTLSNYTPIGRLGFQYEIFVARMSKSDNIAFEDGFTSGYPRLAGMHLAIEPASGWSLAFNRIMQYGGGERGGTSAKDVFDAFFQPSKFDNAGTDLSADAQFGNQAASFTSRFLFPGRRPFAVYLEYAGEDTSRGKNYLLGNADLSAGIELPQVWRRLDLTYEISEWQNGWYEHNIYQDGLVNDGRIIGHWAGDQRQLGDAVGGLSQMLRANVALGRFGNFSLTARTLTNEEYRGVNYEHAHDFTARYSIAVKQVTVGGEVFAGKTVFGDDFSRIAAFAYWSPTALNGFSLLEDDAQSFGENETGEIFVDAGVNANQVKIDVSDDVEPVKTKTATSPHIAVGARRAVTEHSDLGVRLEYDDVDGHALIGARALDYRYRFGDHFAVGTFLGAARYDLDTPAFGFYGGVGVQWRNLLPGWDVGIDARYATKVARDHVLPSDPAGGRPDSFYDITSGTLYLTKHF